MVKNIRGSQELVYNTDDEIDERVSKRRRRNQKAKKPQV